MSDARRLSCCVVGLGAIGGVHAAAIAESRQGELSVCCDVERARAAACPAGARFTEDIEDALAEPGLGAVIVATPEPTHRVVVELALERGLAVLCEKPIAGSLADADAMIAAAERTGALLALGHAARFDPGYRRVAEALADGSLGEPVHLLARRASNIAEREVYAARTSLAVELAVHDLDLFRWLAGDIERVYAEISTLPDGERETSLVATLRFRSGAVGALEASWAYPPESGIDFESELLLVGTRGVARYRHGEDSSLEDESRSAIAAELDHFFAHVRGVADWPLGLADARAALAASLALDRSAATGSPIEIDAQEGVPR